MESHVDSTSNDARASIFHKCALFAEKQYHGITGSEEIRRLHVYSERKSKEIADRDEALRDPRNRSVMRELAQHQKKAKALQAQDVAQGPPKGLSRHFALRSIGEFPTASSANQDQHRGLHSPAPDTV